jgi:hypothetical protein
METEMKKRKKGLSLEECIKRADKYIAEQGLCVLAMDVKNSGKYLREDANAYTDKLRGMVRDLNHAFALYLPTNKIVNGAEEKGFKIVRGDQVIGAIDSVEAIRKIHDYQVEHYPELPLYWGVAKDGWDEKGFRSVD